MRRPPSALRRLLLALGGGAALPSLGGAAEDDDRIAPGRVLRFPRDHGAHPGLRIEWWYATGWLAAPGATAPAFGFQLTFFRSRTGLDGDGGRFVPRQLLFAHAAITDLSAQRHRHAQRVQRWSGDEAQPALHARRADADIALGAWTLRRSDAGPNRDDPSRFIAALPAPDAGFDLQLTLDATQPRLLQGDAGHSRKGPQPQQASHYVTQPQLAVQAALTLAGRAQTLQGRAWMDHEWSDELLADGAIGWDWMGINLDGGGALTAFVLRRADGSTVWAGGSHRTAGSPTVRAFAPAEVKMAAGRTWTSPRSGARYPVIWHITTPAGEAELVALLDDQELDSRGSTGAVYWEGLAELRRPGGGRIGLGYLEMTGRATPLRLY